MARKTRQTSQITSGGSRFACIIPKSAGGLKLANTCGDDFLCIIARLFMHHHAQFMPIVWFGAMGQIAPMGALQAS
ncbi:hypothetical protein ACK6D9_14010 [Hoeflea sp. Naph1]|uniref:hypothetical protein n=1 Tax=Hoeflea sp. Naph1 TaxID=3388653 RepID=UPI0039901D56